MKIGIIGSKLNLLSGSAKPLFQIMESLNNEGITSLMLTDSLSKNSNFFYNQSVEEIQKKLEKKININNLNINRIEGNLIQNLINSDEKTLEIIENFINECDVIIATDFMFAWLMQKRNVIINKPLVYLASNNIDLSIKYFIDAGPLSFVNLFIPDYLIRLFIPKFLNIHFIKRFDYIIATSRYVEEIFKKYKLDMPIFNVPIGVDNFCEYISVNNNDYLSFAYFGWGSNIRGLNDVAKAFERYRSKGGNGKLKLYLQGMHGFEERYLVKKIRNKIEDAEIRYFSENIELDILSNSIVLLPFRVPFGYSQPPLVVLESMALGRCVISTNVGSIPEYIENDCNGLLVKKKDYEKISELMLTLNMEEINRLGHNAYKHMNEKHSWAIVIKKYIDVFYKIYNDFHK